MELPNLPQHFEKITDGTIAGVGDWKVSKHI
jgi:hypothetical protein